MYKNGITLNATSYNSLFANSPRGSKLYVPVKPNAVIYSQLSHVRGTPAKPNQGTVSLDKIHILNRLIDQLISMNKEVMSKDDVQALSDTQKDAAIENYQQQIHQAVAAASQPETYGLAGLIPEAGAVFNIDI